MSVLLPWVALLFGLAVGTAAGAWWGRNKALGVQRQADDRLQDQQAQAADALRAALDRVGQVRSEMQSRLERIDAERSAELDTIKRHLGEAYGELDRMRVLVAATGERPADPPRAFAATQPMKEP